MLRVVVRLEASESGLYEYEYHHHLQGLIYGLVKDTRYSYLHDKEGYKFFCMSNIFPAVDLRKGHERTLIVSSPDEGFIGVLRRGFLQLEEVRVGEMRFKVRAVKIVRGRLAGGVQRLITGTPIVVRVPRERYGEYGIVLEKPYEYLYWRKEYPLNAFVKQLEENLVKKFQDFYGVRVEDSVLPFFQTLMFRKQVSTRLHFEEGTQTVIGTTWEFMFRSLSREQLKLLEFGLDAGFGEMNSKGFGFMNVMGQATHPNLGEEYGRL